jgi:hypothetical protein
LEIAELLDMATQLPALSAGWLVPDVSKLTTLVITKRLTAVANDLASWHVAL